MTAPEPTSLPTPPTSRWNLWTALRDPDGYLVLLLLTVAQLVIWTLVLDRDVMIHVLAYWLLLVTILVAFHRARIHPMAFRIMTTLFVAMGIVWSITAFVSREQSTTENETMIGIVALIYAGMLAMTFPLLVRRAFAHTVVSMNTVFAMLSAYMFIGLFYASLFRAVGAFGESVYVQRATNNSANAVYFAFECLTTLGLGDLSPVSGIPRVLTILCALSGQLFLVTAVARIVSLYGQERAGTVSEER